MRKVEFNMNFYLVKKVDISQTFLPSPGCYLS